MGFYDVTTRKDHKGMTSGSAEHTPTDLTQLQARLHTFAVARNWQRHHDPKNLAISLAIEVGELLECFQWLTDEQACDVRHDQAKMSHVRGELADVFIYLIHLANALNVDLLDATNEKIDINEHRFPKNQPATPELS